ncbi:MAG TPA: serine/threonine-protein kinase, partial [Thermoanaerobaculia bacterium]|nr:serine/threonine-protein kinase [Thermoanaerobaculia bacterium]
MSVPAPEKKTFGQYDVESTLGRGAMGMVYLARDRRIGRRVALKTVQLENVLDDDESTASEFFKRLQREAELSGALQHPNIVTLYEAGYENDQITFLACEYVEGENLKEFLKKHKPLPVALALSIAEDLLRGLAYAHARGIIHRDIKPANILMTVDRQAKIADFGIARPHDSSLTSVGALLGTPNYMSPEQVRSSGVSPRSDLFSTGVVLYEMLTGKKPFAAEDLSGILQRVLNHNPEDPTIVNSAVPPAVSAFVAKLLAKSPDDRFATADAALAELRNVKEALDPHEGPPARNRDPREESATMHASEWSSPTLKAEAAPFLQRRVPSPAAWSMLLIALAAITGAFLVARNEINRAPMQAITPQQVAEANAKKQALSNAQALFEARRYDESIRAYDTYLSRYPYSITAQERRQEAIRARDAEKKASSTMTVRARSRQK